MEFALQFKTLTGHEPFPWQADLYRCFTQADVPEVCDIPTGLGKTSVIPIWAIALANSIAVPRRLVYVINRRTVVDQATEEAIRLREQIPFPLAISTLRGEMADNEEWSTDPARPAIIIGTIDMVGSRLLFSGYGDGYKRRPHHAGLLGQDCLIVHDEAHLTPAFSVLLQAISGEQRKGGEPRPIRVMELSAASRQALGSVLSLSAADEQHEIVRQRLKAAKRLVIHSTDRSKLPQKLVELAANFEDQGVKVAIYTRQPEVASKVKQGLSKLLGYDRVALLTGTIRVWFGTLLSSPLCAMRLISAIAAANDASASDRMGSRAPPYRKHTVRPPQGRSEPREPYP
jgi:CRISPR-associated endonuclease/helicase Cas3